MHNAEYWIAHLGLIPYREEGGFFRQVYRSSDTLTALPARYSGPRCASTSIYYLLKSGQCSRLHRLKSDEIWHFYAGSRLTLHIIEPGGRYTTSVLGPGAFQIVARAGDWFGATVNDPDSYSLVGCTVAPGFDIADHEMGDRAALQREYPQHHAIIEKLTK
jgi:predicted cupin superfamily sugar epimerase